MSDREPSPTLVLVHSPLVGPLCWTRVAAELERRGFRVVVPSMARTLEAGPPYRSRLAAIAAESVRTAAPTGAW